MSRPFDHFSGVPDGWICIFQDGFIVSIQISTGQGAAIVADDHSVGIEHGNDFEDEVIAQKLNKPRETRLVSRRKLSLSLSLDRTYLSIC